MPNKNLTIRKRFPLSKLSVAKRTAEITLPWFLPLLLLSLFSFFIYLTVIVAFGVQDNFGRNLTIAEYFAASIAAFSLLIIYYTFIKQSQNFADYFYNFTENFIIIKKGAPLREEIIIPYSLVKDAFLNQNYLGKILQIYDLSIIPEVTVPLDINIYGFNKQNAEDLKTFLLQAAKEKKTLTDTQSPPTDTTQIKEETGNVFSTQNSFIKKYAVLKLPVVLFSLCIGACVYLFSPFFTSVQGYGLLILLFLSLGVIGSIALYFVDILTSAGYTCTMTKNFFLFRKNGLKKKIYFLPYTVIYTVTITQDFLDKKLNLFTVLIDIVEQETEGEETKKDIYILDAQTGSIQVPGLTKNDAEKLREQLMRKKQITSIEKF